MMYFELKGYSPMDRTQLVIGRFESSLEATACQKVIVVVYDSWLKSLNGRRAAPRKDRKVYLDFVTNIFPSLDVDNLDVVFQHQALVANFTLIGQMNVVPVQVIERIDSSLTEDLNYMLRQYDTLLKNYENPGRKR
jgi:hypothetical protein